MNARRVHVTEDHIAVIRRLHISTSSEDCVIPLIDARRPLGNSAITDDLANVLGIEAIESDEGESFLPKGTSEHIAKRLKQLPEAFEAVLRTASFEPGIYETAGPYDSRWRRVK